MKIIITLIIAAFVLSLLVLGRLYATPPKSGLPLPQAGSILISAPQPDSVVIGGHNLTVRIVPGIGTTLRKASAWFLPPNSVPQTVTSAHFEIQLQVPLDKVGPVTVKAVGIDADGNSLETSVRIFVVAPTPPQTLSVEPAHIVFLKVGESINLGVSGMFQDGVERDLTSSPDTQYQSTNTKVANVGSDGSVQAIAPGVASINVSFTNLIKVIPVSVGVFEVRGDLNGDYNVNQDDVNILSVALNTPASGPGDPRDLNNDGKIDSADLQILTSLCSSRGCKAPTDTNIDIDIKPGDAQNSINLKSQGNIPVAILSDTSFNAPAAVDTSSLRFGRTGNEPSLAFCNPRGEDVNGDGLPDLVCHFYTQKTGFQVGDTLGVLKGATLSLIPIRGKDSVRIVP